MNEKPILFSGEMVRAILDGRKTQTRRALQRQPLDILPMNRPNEWIGLMTRDPNHGIVFKCRYGIPGDRLWVRETWAVLGLDSVMGDCLIAYRADGELSPVVVCHHRHVPNSYGWGKATRLLERKWRPSIFMPRWVSRITLDITDVWMERVQDITSEGAIEEGCYSYIENYQEPLDEFKELWNSINTKRGFGWDMNPWVWVVEFKKVAQ